MKIIYDEDKAILEKQQKDSEVPERNKRARTHNVIVVLATIAVLVGLFFGWKYIHANSSFSDNTGAFIWPLSAAAVICIWLAHFAMKEVVPDYMRYSANTQYYLLKGDKKVLDHSLSYNNRAGGYELCLDLEDENHIVTRVVLWPFCLKSERRTDIGEIVVDLEKEIVYQPYNI